MTNDVTYKDGLLRHNAVLAEGMVIAPIVACCDTLQKALLLSLQFVIVTVLTVFIGSFYSRRLPYAFRILLYVLTASVLYIPSALLCEYIAPATYADLSVLQLPGLGEVSGAAFMYLPLLSVNSFIVLHSELHFYHYRRGKMLGVLTAHAAGFTLAACFAGSVREILAHGTLFGFAVDMPIVMKGFAAPWGAREIQKPVSPPARFVERGADAYDLLERGYSCPDHPSGDQPRRAEAAVRQGHHTGPQDLSRPLHRRCGLLCHRSALGRAVRAPSDWPGLRRHHALLRR